MSESLDVFMEEKEAKACDMVNGPHVYFYCSNCNAPLLDIWLFNPTPDVKYKVRADCPFCGDHSYVQDIKSDTFGPTGIDCPGGAYCSVGEWDFKEINDEEIVVYQMVKQREYINE